MSLDKKRTSLPDAPPTYPPSSSSSSHSYARVPVARSSYSPPASSYIPSFDHDGHCPDDALSIPHGESHFAYSTTLRRHHQADPLEAGMGAAMGLVHHPFDHVPTPEQGGLVEKILRAVGLDRFITERDADSGRGRPERNNQEETASLKFAHYTPDQTLSHFRTHPQNGLSSSIVPDLRAQYGYNEFSVQPPSSLILKFLETIYESPLNMLLFGSAAVSAFMGNTDDAISITVAILIVLTVGFVQERRSEKSLEALNKLVPHHAHLIRDGRTTTVLANELLPGDLVTFTVGDRVPADIRLLSAVDLEIDESSLTGETRAAVKSVDACDAAGGPVPLGERTSIAFMGTLVRNGRGSGIVIATGTDTEFGIIFAMMQDVEEKRTPLQLSMDELAKNLSILSFGVIGVICLIGVWQQRSWLEMFTIGVSLAVAAIPEGLPIVTTVTLALGVLRMARRKAIVKKLPSVEALGSVSVICSDKTGTLTMNEQTVVEAYVVDETIHVPASTSTGASTAPRIPPALLKTLHIGALCNNAFRNHGGVNVGQSTDVALLNVLDKFGVGDVRTSFNRTSERPFNSEVKYMAVSGTHTHASNSVREMYYTKGSIDAVLARCRFFYVSDDATPALDNTTRTMIMGKAEEAAARGLRVIAMAYGFGSIADHDPNPGTQTTTATPSNLVFAGFEAMLDPPRKGVAESIASLHAGGVQVVMITGDAAETAMFIARQLGLRVQMGRRGGSLSGSGGSGASGVAMGSCLTGREMDAMDDRQLRERVGSVAVFARTTPRHKLRIVQAYQARGAVVAMTGDGVNDAPALKQADIGVSMGSGTDVAKEAADVILVDDNFGTILSAIEEGKSIFHNIQNFLSFQLSTAVAALSLITLSTVFQMSNPLNAMQILFINILMDGPPSQSLGVDPADRAVMRRPPRPKNAPIITSRLLTRVLFSASMIVIGTLFVYIHELSDGSMSRRDQTMTFTCFVFLDLASALQNRGLGCGLFQNRMLITTVSVSFIVQLALIYVPAMQTVFQTEALSSHDLMTLLLLGATSMGLHEVRRRYERAKSAGAHSMVDDLA
ncbi:hypothetical protein BOTBODRAFT_51572 [Botryobasidium botryosum FD-172 SS1]|uniref:Calcium-transporting ATPase 1 n=1 Tax=Botryobasidium botryosum (strain FD-172 SS1) TaxID=930990 RepID=A0A067N903_BOTB1|nr:hypothetical protein BOTBODRAFT_51572 [Botryobasidium botryosum FD-172 SS1]